MGDDSCSRGREFESRRRALNGHDIFSFNCKNCIVCLKINKKEARVGSFYKNPWIYIFTNESSNNWRRPHHGQTSDRSFSGAKYILTLVMATVALCQCDHIWRNFCTFAKKLKNIWSFSRGLSSIRQIFHPNSTIFYAFDNFFIFVNIAIWSHCSLCLWFHVSASRKV